MTDDSEFDLDDDGLPVPISATDEAAARLKQDPAQLAVHAMLEHALTATGTTAEAAGADGVICLVTLPSNDWGTLARSEWYEWIRDGERHLEGRRRNFDHVAKSLAMLATSEPRRLERDDQDEEFAKAVCKARHCVGFAANTAWLPSDLVHAADLRLVLPTLTSADVGVIAEQLTGDTATEALSEAQATQLTPRLLRLAKRRDQTADAYLRKLGELIRRDTAVAEDQAVDVPPLRDVPTLDRLHGLDEAVAWGMALAGDIQGVRDGVLTWGDVDRGCLLSGPPGCGKTMFARALAASCGVGLVVGSYGQWHGSGGAHQGDLLKAMRKTFSDARAGAPCILFIDEVDSFPNRATIKHHYVEWETQVVNALLAEIDGVENRAGVIVVAACNHPHRLDPALTRSGRLDRHIHIHLPDRAALGLILREHLGSDLAGQDLSAAALVATGASGADCARLGRGARRRARAAAREMLLADLLDEIGGSDARSPADLRVAAVHEAGHAVMTCILRPGTLDMVSLQDSSSHGGFVASLPSTSKHVLASDVRERITILLAGRAAEELLLGAASSGAGGSPDSDLARATHLATHAATALGLDDASGLVWRGQPELHHLPETLATNAPLAEQVRCWLDDAYEASLDLLRTHIAPLNAMASALIERRIMDGPDIEALIQQHLDAGVMVS